MTGLSWHWCLLLAFGSSGNCDQAPLPGRCKVIPDGSRKHALGYIGAGGLLRDHAAWEAGFRSVEVECDSKSVVGLLLNPPSHTHPLFSIINCCYLLIQKEWCCSVKHIFPPGVVVDLLAANARSLACPRMIVVYSSGSRNFSREVLLAAQISRPGASGRGDVR
ncbi:unnamed protein product [Prunus armeniaca]